MSEERLKKIERFAAIADKKLSMAAELCLCAIASELGLPVPAQYKRGETGKPEFPVSPPYFNITHCDGYSICAVADSPVGIDAEPADRTVSSSIAKRLLRAGESCHSLIWKWVEKESFVKLTGEGLLRPLAGFTASSDGIFDANGKRLAKIARYELQGLCIAVASYEEISSSVIKILSPAYLKTLLSGN
ncbi:MAG: hypothetical protein IKM29_05050 [Clostridia bacterium]|nr:hypothetical protein [Clostridia bacterium]